MPALERTDHDHRHGDEGHGLGHDHDHDHDHDDHGRGDDHGHAHGHGHGHGHGHAPASFGRAFLVGIVLNTAFVVGEAVYGLRANSVALLADAGHNLSDVLGLFLAWGATAFATVRPSRRYTYGLRSTSILAALANALLLMAVTGGIAWEAIGRLRHPEPAQGMVVVAVAAVGVAINLATALMFMSGRKRDLNVRAAFAHMAADAAISLGVVVAGLVILRTGWLWLDPAASIVISVLVIVGTWGVLRDSLGLALHGVPDGIDLEAVRRYLAACPGVSEVHDLHVWGLSTTHAALTAHLVTPGGHPGDAQRRQITAGLRQRFGIDHVTLQTELGDAGHPCELAPDEVI